MRCSGKLAAIFALLIAPAFGQSVFPYPGGWCQKGGQGVVTSGLKSSGTYTLPSGSLISGTGVQASYGQCRVTVYNTGTIIKPTIYSSSSLGVLTNPFTANVDGSFRFYATAGCYDVVTDQASMPAAHTDSICLGSGGVPGSGTVTQVNPATDAGTFNPLFTFGFSNQTTTPTLAFTLLTAGAHTVFGNGTGSSAFPSYFTLGTSDLPFTYGGNTTKLATVGATFSGTGAGVCRDASGNLTTSGCVGTGVTSWNTRTGAVLPASGDYAVADVTGAAPLASPTFTGTPAAPTAAPGTSTTQLATTNFVATSFAPLASPTFTGIPLAPTAAVDTSTTQIATTAFVVAQPTHGLLLTSVGTGVPSPLAAVACPPGQGVSQYLFNASSQYQDIQSLDVTTVSNPAPPAGTINNCWREWWNDSGVAGLAIRNSLMAVEHRLGHGGQVSDGAADERAFAARIANADPLFQEIHQMLTNYNEAVLTGTPNFHGHAGGEVDVSGVRASINDGRTGTGTGLPGFITGMSSQVTRSSTAPIGGGGFWTAYRATVTDSGGGSPGATAGFVGYLVDSFANIGGTTTGGMRGVMIEAPTTRWPTSNLGLFIQNFGATANDFNLRSDGVNSAGTPAGHNAAQGPFTFGQIAFAAANYQTDTLGGVKIKASAAGGNMLGLFGFTSGSALLGVADAAGTPNRMNLPIATATTIGDSLTSDAANPQQLSWSPRTAAYTCGTTTTCSASLLSGPPKIVRGTVALTGGAATVTGLPSFTSTSTFSCTASDNTDTTGALGANAIPASATSITVTGSAVGTDVISYLCSGN